MCFKVIESSVTVNIKMNFYYILLIVCFFTNIQCINNPALARFPGCLSHNTADDKIDTMTIWSEKLISDITADNNKGYYGTIAIIGGGASNTYAPYFAALSALRAGADHVQVFCTKAAGEIIRSFNPDVSIFPILDVSVDKILTMLASVDVVILGPGLEHDAHSSNAVIPKVITHCKNEKKPLILDFSEYFLTATVLNLIIKYPEPGVIMTPNTLEFEKLYELLKITTSNSKGDVQIDFNKYTKNMFILRKGCTDVGVSHDSDTSWALYENGCPKRSLGQGSMLVGILGTHFMWADKVLPKNFTKIYGTMFQASIASYSAAKIVRRTCEFTYNEHFRSTVTSDIIDKIYTNI